MSPVAASYPDWRAFPLPLGRRLGTITMSGINSRATFTVSSVEWSSTRITSWTQAGIFGRT